MDQEEDARYTALEKEREELMNDFMQKYPHLNNIEMKHAIKQCTLGLAELDLTKSKARIRARKKQKKNTEAWLKEVRKHVKTIEAEQVDPPSDKEEIIIARKRIHSIVKRHKFLVERADVLIGRSKYFQKMEKLYTNS